MPIGNESNHVMDGLTVRGGLGLTNNLGQVATVDYDRFACMARNAVAMRAQGYYAETYPRGAIAGSTVSVNGTIHFGAVGLLAGDVVTAVSVYVQTLASGFSGTGVTLGLYTKSGALCASSADAQAAFGSTGMKTTAMTTPYTVPSDDLYYAAILSVASTPPVLLRGSSGISGGGWLAVSPSVYGGFGTDTSEAALGAQQTISFSGLAISYWMAIS
jgi:hypothetical protein